MIERRGFSVEDLHKMAEAGLFAEGERIELLAGNVYETTPVGRRQAAMVAKLVSRLSPLPSSDRALLWVQNPLQLPPFGEPEPDVALLRYSEHFYELEVPKPQDVLLLIEVADSTLNFDRHVKLPVYAEAGVAEYWIVNLVYDRTDVFREPDGQAYRTAFSVPFGSPLSPLAFPDVSLTL